MVRFTAHSDGKVLVPDEPVELPAGQRFVVTVEPVKPPTPKNPGRPQWVQKALELAQLMPTNLPEDLAEQHDHYIHGTPKR
jgi:hypothetical protein